MKHFKFGSSTASRTLACPAWADLSEGVPRSSSDAATKGTIIHDIAEMLALDKAIPSKVYGHDVTDEHIEAAERMWAVANEVFDQYGVHSFEPEVTGTVRADIGGTIDLVGKSDDTIIILDYKTGSHQVSPENNSQILFAAAVCAHGSRASDMFDGIDKFVGVIVQPDLHGDIRAKEWVFTREDFELFWVDFMSAVGNADTDPAPGEHCTFCPAAATRCPAKNGDALRALQMNPKDLSQLSENMVLVGDLKKWCKVVEDVTLEQLSAGASVPGFKQVAKRAIENWTDPERMIEKLKGKFGKKRLVEQKPLTPAAVRRLAKSLDIEVDLTPLTEKKSNGTTIAPENDKREAIVPAGALAAALNSAK